MPCYQRFSRINGERRGGAGDDENEIKSRGGGTGKGSQIARVPPTSPLEPSHRAYHQPVPRNPASFCFSSRLSVTGIVHISYPIDARGLVCAVTYGAAIL